jgi:hypothetical protein
MGLFRDESVRISNETEILLVYVIGHGWGNLGQDVHKLCGDGISNAARGAGLGLNGQ